MNTQNPIGFNRLILATLLPLVAFVLQWMFWGAIKPYVWFLFFPAVFFSAWIGGLYGGVIATVLSATLVWWFFIPPERSFALENPFSLVSIGLFVVMGVLFGYSQERVRRANWETASALAAARSANEQLQEANEKITQLYEKTRELDQLKTRFFANVSHELRTPLTLILGPVAKRLAIRDLGDAERRDLEMIDRNARLLHHHVTDLLDVAKLEAGRTKMHYSPVDLAGMVRLAASHFEIIAGEKKIRSTVEVPENLPAQVDAEKAQRILLNLLSNAFKFTPDGGTIALSLSEADGRAIIRVEDNGPGVPAPMREAIFERFQQVEGGTNRRFGGTGLGLAIVKDFVELHGGTVAATEAPGGGALFTVTLPLTAPEGTEVATAPEAPGGEIDRQVVDAVQAQCARAGRPAPEVAADAPLVLVVEDNADMRAFVADALGLCYRVVTAVDGQDGLHKALAVRPDLIVSDVMMPKMSGDQMVEALRARREMDDVPIVMLTARADEATRVGLLKSGVQDYINKPFSVEELLARIGGLVDRRRQVAERTLKEIRHLNDELEQRVRQRTAQLEVANKELEAFCYSVSHDLRAPLRHIDGYVELLRGHADTVLTDKGRRYLDTISDSAKRMGRLIDDLLAFSRTGRAQMSLSELDTDALVNEVIRDLSSELSGRAVEWRVQELPRLHADSALVKQVFANLLGNAVKYTAPRSPAIIEVSGNRGEGEVVITVKDNGVGFDMQYADKLFGVFQRLHSEAEFEGTGVGLANVRRIIARHGGRTWAEGAVDGGAEFHFSLPVQAGSPATT